MKDNIWENKLSQGEKIEQEFSVSKRFIKGIVIICVLLGIILLPLFGLGLIFIIIGIASWWMFPFRYRYAFTNKRVLLLDRWTTSKLTSINLDQITDVHVRTTFSETFMYKMGVLSLETAGKDSETVIKYVENPYQLMQNLNNLRDKQRGNN